MNKISLVSCLLLCSFISTTYAKDIRMTSLQSTWGIDKNVTCGGSGADAGFSATDKSNNNVIDTNLKWSEYLVNNWTYNGGTQGRDGFNAVYYLASAKHPHGYRFCKTVVAGDRWGDATMTDVVFYKPAVEDCFDLCEEGYYGTACLLRTPLKKTLDITRFDVAKSLSTGHVHNLSNNERSTNSADVIRLKQYITGCGGNRQIDLKSPKGQEHKVVLALKTIKTETNAIIFTIQPMVIRAGAQPGAWLHTAKGYKYAWPMVSFYGTERSNYCPSFGFVYENGKCVVDEHAQNYQALQAAMKAAQEQERKDKELVCPDWKDKLKYYDNTQHEFFESSYNNAMCKKFRCPASTNLGFYNTRSDYDSSSATSPYACVSCNVATADGGNVAKDKAVHGVDNDGNCITCDLGTFYDEASKTCVKAEVIDMRNMAYGPGKNNRDDLKLQCWTMAEPSCYRKCINGESVANLKEAGCVHGDVDSVDSVISGKMDKKYQELDEQYEEDTVEFDRYTDTVNIK